MTSHSPSPIYTIPTSPEFWGDDVTQDEARAYAEELAKMMREFAAERGISVEIEFASQPPRERDRFTFEDEADYEDLYRFAQDHFAECVA